MRRVLTERNKGKLKAALTRYMDGVIAEEGTHAQLLEKDGIYAKLYKTQTNLS
jgi:ABC-type transport system involved in cytochrome bd biosynthesis fused ATPase/permease subunit